jgi:hypothetical protein
MELVCRERERPTNVSGCAQWDVPVVAEMVFRPHLAKLAGCDFTSGSAVDRAAVMLVLPLDAQAVRLSGSAQHHN